MSNSTDQYVLADDLSGEVSPPEEWHRTISTESMELDPSLGEILRAVFDMGVGERETYEALAEREYSKASDLADELGRDRSSVHRYLKELLKKGLVTRRRRILQSGGHVYQYSARSPEQVRELLLAGLSEWVAAAQNQIEEFVAESAGTEQSTPVGSPVGP